MDNFMQLRQEAGFQEHAKCGVCEITEYESRIVVKVGEQCNDIYMNDELVQRASSDTAETSKQFQISTQSCTLTSQNAKTNIDILVKNKVIFLNGAEMQIKDRQARPAPLAFYAFMTFAFILTALAFL